MHKCLSCGKEFEGKFCPECGKKWIDPDACPKCGAHHDADAKFCPECGARLDGKVNCPECGALTADAAFCGQCGARLHGNTAVTAHGEVARGKVQSIVALCGAVCLILSALIGLVFAFVAGVSLVDADSGKLVETSMLYEFFGDAYKDADKVHKALKDTFQWSRIGTQREFALYFPIVIGTVVSAVGLLGVTCLFGLTVFKAYRKYYKNEQANVAAPAVATYLTFATMATVLLMLVASETDAGDVSIYSSSLVSKAVFSTPTLAGIITGGVLLGLGVLLTAASNYNAFRGFNASVGAIFAVVVSALAAVVMGLVALPSVGLEFDLYDLVGLDYSAKASFGLFTGMEAILAFIADDDTFTEVVTYLAIGGGAAVVLAIISAAILFMKVPAVGNGRNRNTVILGAVAVAVAVVYLVFSILSINAIVDALMDLIGEEAENEEKIREMIQTTYTVPIATLVITVLAFVAEVAGKFIRKREPARAVEMPAQAE